MSSDFRVHGDQAFIKGQSKQGLARDQLYGSHVSATKVCAGRADLSAPAAYKAPLISCVSISDICIGLEAEESPSEVGGRRSGITTCSACYGVMNHQGVIRLETRRDNSGNSSNDLSMQAEV